MDPVTIALQFAVALVTVFGPGIEKAAESLLAGKDIVDVLAAERVESILPQHGQLELAMLAARAKLSGVTMADVIDAKAKLVEVAKRLA